jgi:hypothetical protein
VESPTDRGSHLETNYDNEPLKTINKLNGEGRKVNIQLASLLVVPTPPSETLNLL